MGDVVMGNYHFGLSSWNYKLERTLVLDFAIYSNDRDVSIVIPNPPAFDPEVLTRCFTDEVWAVTGLFLCISCALIFIPYFWFSDYDGMTSNKIAFFSMWGFFVLMNAYYSGALTSFFVGEVSLPFSSFREVLKLFPDWKIIYPKGYEVAFESKVRSGDPDYVKYWKYVEADYDKYTVDSALEGFKELQEDKVVMLLQENMMRYTYKTNPHVSPDIQVFDHSNPTFPSIIFPKNSPLTPILKKSMFKMLEDGQSERLLAKWVGAPLKYQQDFDGMILTSGQTFFAFIIIGVMYVITFICFIIEYCHPKILKLRSQWKSAENVRNIISVQP